jgi:hypothetical protein
VGGGAANYGPSQGTDAEMGESNGGGGGGQFRGGGEEDEDDDLDEDEEEYDDVGGGGGTDRGKGGDVPSFASVALSEVGAL